MLDGSNALNVSGAATRSRAVSLAVLKANWDEGGSYLESFLPFVAEIVRRLSNAVVSRSQIRARLDSDFGFEVPDAVLRRIISKGIDKGLFERAGREGIRGHAAALDAVRMDHVEDETARCQRSLTAALVAFSGEIGDSPFSPPESESALLAFVEQFGLLALNPTKLATAQYGPVSNAMTVTALFVEHLEATDPVGFAHLLRLVHGSMLAAAVFVPYESEEGRRLRPMTAFLDTPLVLDLLGYHGEARHLFATELVEVAQRDGLRVATFERTVDEVRAIVRRARAGQVSQVARVLRFRHLMPSDFELLALRVPADLGKQGVSTMADLELRDPAWVARTSSVIRDSVLYSSEDQVTHDASALAMVRQLRRRDHVALTRTTEAVFVTSNDALVRAAPGKAREPGKSWPLCMGATDFASVVWLRNPQVASTLPARQVIAACYAAFRPTQKTIDRYVSELRQIQANGEVTEEELAFFQLAPELGPELVRAELMHVPPEGTRLAEEVMRAIRQRLAEEELGRRVLPALADVTASAEVPMVVEQLTVSAAPLSPDDAEILAARFGSTVGAAVRWSLLVIALTYWVAQLVGWRTHGPPQLAMSLLAIVCGALGVLGLANGSHIASVADSVGRRAEKWLLRRFRSVLARKMSRY